jgi:hypothetical protein
LGERVGEEELVIYLLPSHAGGKEGKGGKEEDSGTKETKKTRCEKEGRIEQRRDRRRKP